MGFSRQEYWSGVPLPSPIILPTTEQNLALVCLLFSGHMEVLSHLNLLKAVLVRGDQLNGSQSPLYYVDKASDWWMENHKGQMWKSWGKWLVGNNEGVGAKDSGCKEYFWSLFLNQEE